jgi:hypothetical protein
MTAELTKQSPKPTRTERLADGAGIGMRQKPNRRNGNLDFEACRRHAPGIKIMGTYDWPS